MNEKLRMPQFINSAFWAFPFGSGFPLYLFCEKAKKDAAPIPNAPRPNLRAKRKQSTTSAQQNQQLSAPLRLCVQLFFLLLFSATSFAQQTKIDWQFLAKVKWDERYFPKYEETVYYPVFSDEVTAMDGKLVELQGFVIPVDVEADYYVLSANPFASCFFCGNAGPESVVELQLTRNDNTFRTDERATFTGRLKLNWDDLEHCNYILENAQQK